MKIVNGQSVVHIIHFDIMKVTGVNKPVNSVVAAGTGWSCLKSLCIF